MKRAIFNQKGGVGKTSIVCNLAAAMAQLGRKTLVVDLDAQSNSSQYLLGNEFPKVSSSVADFFASTLSFKLFKDSLQKTIVATQYENLYVVPADLSLIELQPKLEGRYKIFKLSEALLSVCEKLGFEEVLIDTPPALNFYTMSALLSADRVLIPFDCDAFSAEAVKQVIAAVTEVREDHRPELEIEGIIVNQYSQNAKQPKLVLDEIKKEGLAILEPYLTNSVAMRESHSAHSPLVYFKKSHPLSKKFLMLASELSEELRQVRSKGSSKNQSSYL